MSRPTRITRAIREFRASGNHNGVDDAHLDGDLDCDLEPRSKHRADARRGLTRLHSRHDAARGGA